MSKGSTGSKQTPEITSVAGDADSYRTRDLTIPFFSRVLPSGAFYGQLISTVCRSSARAKRGEYADFHWYRSSLDVMEALESVGVRVEISGLEHLRDAGGPVVLVGNHMSMLETFVLPGVVRPYMPVTFVVKEGLLNYPVFSHVMRSRDPVAVGRSNPREDFATVMKGGQARLDKGISIIVFPQTTRTEKFDPQEFNTIGIKLAKRASVPVIPLALLTDAWGNGSILKDFGKIDLKKTVHLAFGEPMNVEGNGSQTHAEVIRFIQEKLKEWRA
jgi:1-acyl-sn-glycerol-3-phosphate acyltransferase